MIKGFKKPLLIAALLGVGGALAAVMQAEAGPAAIHITPHRAVYNMSLVESRTQATVNNVGGRMMYAWGDACDGWTSEQRLNLTFAYKSGASQQIKTGLATWEAKDGSLFRFNVQRRINGEEKENYRGRAELAADGTGVAKYADGARSDIGLSAKTMFPAMHTERLLRAALAGETIVNSVVFDGADEGGQNNVTAHIGQPIEVTKPKHGIATASRLGAGRLGVGRAWPISMAFYAPGNTTGMPDYEMRMTLLEDGVTRDMLIDYGDFIVRADLVEVEAAAAPRC